MSEPYTTPHVRAVGNLVADSAHVVLDGHVDDMVLWRGRPVTERAALAAEIRSQVPGVTVIVADAADGLRPLDPSQRPDVERLLAAGAVDGRTEGVLDKPSPVNVAGGARALLRQQTAPVCVLLYDPCLLFDTSSDTGRRGLATLLRGLRDAECVRADGPSPPRNALVAIAAEDVHCLDACRDIVHVRAAPPTQEAYAEMIARLEGGFYGRLDGDEEWIAQRLSALAATLAEQPTRTLERMRRISLSEEISLAEPLALARATRRRTEAGRSFEDLDLARVECGLERAVAGQPDAIGRLVSALRHGRFGDPGRPPGDADRAPRVVVALAGPPGVGKTESCRETQRMLSGDPNHMVRFNCAAELRLPHEVARLVGAPPGYEGHLGGSTLVSQLSENPARVVLFDEADKAHPDVLGALLSIVEDGSLKDGRGHACDFSQSIFMLASNFAGERLKEAITAPEGPPSTAEFLEMGRRLVEQSIRGLGPAGEPLWSRVQNQVLVFDILRREAVPGMVAAIARNIELNLGEHYRVPLRVDNESVARAVADALPPDGQWDGRSLAGRGGVVQRLFTAPLIDLLDVATPRDPMRAWVDDDGVVRLERDRELALEEAS